MKNHFAEALKEAYLEPVGWCRSKREGKSVGYDGMPLPWFTYGAIELLSIVVRSDDRVFEYGSGQSTLWWQARVKEIVSVENDESWRDKLGPQLGLNAKVIYVSAHAEVYGPAATSVNKFFERARDPEPSSYASEKITRRGLDDASFRGYATEIARHNPPFDIVVIDGMARRLCAQMSVECLADDGIIVLDNSNRGDYKLCFDIFREHNFIHIPLWGLVPGADFYTCTSLFFRNVKRMPASAFTPNTFSLPQY